MSSDNTRVVEGMAVDEPMPDIHDDAVRPGYAARRLEQHMHAMLFLLNYLAHVQDTGFVASHAVPGDPVAPTGGAADSDGFAWGGQCANELLNTRPSDAAGVAADMLVQARTWCEQSGFVPTVDFYLANAPTLLNALCPPEHRKEADVLLLKFLNEMATGQPSSVAETAGRRPIATIHVAAAMTAAVFAEPACVPDQARAQLELTSKLQEILA